MYTTEFEASELGNPLSELISDDVYQLLASQGLINEKSLRNYLIRQKFKQMRRREMGAAKAISQLRSEYPYLQFDTLRKIVYNIK
ncbi:MAG: hypothetical protein GXO87_06010 [Chlorobi bacterium]|nr:hypothetical protein [Chlorobiota bacterium]